VSKAYGVDYSPTAKKGERVSAELNQLPDEDDAYAPRQKPRRAWRQRTALVFRLMALVVAVGGIVLGCRGSLNPDLWVVLAGYGFASLACVIASFAVRPKVGKK
jgi:hypothetical protein